MTEHLGDGPHLYDEGGGGFEIYPVKDLAQTACVT